MANPAASSVLGIMTDTVFLPNKREAKLPSSSGDFFGACRDVDEFFKGAKVGEGTYGVVYHVQDLYDNSDSQYAVKRIRVDNENDGFPVPSVREVSLLRQLTHKNIVRVEEVVVAGALDRTFMLMEFCDRDLASVLDCLNGPLNTLEVKYLMYQLLDGMTYLHNNFVVHRDLKLANLLLTNEGVLKIADFGLARKFSLPARPMTPKVVTLWYRPPELLLGEKVYNVAVDNWSIGCIFGELLLNAPLLPGKSEIEQLNLIFNLLGSPTEDSWPSWTSLPNAAVMEPPIGLPSKLRERFSHSSVDEAGFKLLTRFLAYDPRKRMTCPKALRHRFFAGEPITENILRKNPHISRLMDECKKQAADLRTLTQDKRRERGITGDRANWAAERRRNGA